MFGLTLDFVTRAVASSIACCLKADAEEQVGSSPLCVVKVDPTADFDFTSLAKQYLEDFGDSNPFAATDVVLGRLVVAGPEDLGGEAPFAHDRFAVDFLESNNIRHVLVSYLRCRSGRIMGVVCLGRQAGEPGFSSSEKAFMRRGVPLVSHSLLTASTAQAASDFTRDERLKVLTRRELDVSRMVAAGARNEDIGKSLHITLGTVKTHLHNIYKKLDIDSRVQLSVIFHSR